jgi:hypothetical protein
MADHSYQVVILERHVLCRCDFLLPNRRTSILTAVAALFMVAFGCDAGSPWTQISQECNSVVGRSFLTPRRS